MAFDSVEDVQRFFDEHGEGTLMAEMRSGRHNDKSTRFYLEWAGAYEVRLRDENFALTRRAVEAAERSAEASKLSSRLAATAAFISLVAILVSLAKEWGWFG